MSILLEKNKSYKFVSVYHNTPEQHNVNFDILSIYRPTGEPPEDSQLNMYIGGYIIKNNGVVVHEYILDKTSLKLPIRKFGCLYSTPSGHTGPTLVYVYIQGEEPVMLNENDELTLLFTWVKDVPPEIRINDCVLFQFEYELPDASSLYTIETQQNIGFGRGVTITFNSVVNFKSSVLSDIQSQIVMYFSKTQPSWVITGNDINVELVHQRKLQFTFFMNIDIEKNTANYERIEIIDITRYLDVFSISLYNNKSEPNKVDKVIVPLLTLNGVLRESCSLITPVITIEYSGVPNFNYVYISKFNRYYYVREITNIRNNLWNISLKVDVLMSFKTQIEALEDVFIERNEFEYDERLYDEKFPFKKGTQYSIVDGTDEIAFTDGDTTGYDGIVLSVVGKLGDIISGGN